MEGFFLFSGESEPRHGAFLAESLWSSVPRGDRLIPGQGRHAREHRRSWLNQFWSECGRFSSPLCHSRSTAGHQVRHPHTSSRSRRCEYSVCVHVYVRERVRYLVAL